VKSDASKHASLRNPARLVVKGTTVEDEFPNWFHFLHKKYNSQSGPERSGSDAGARALNLGPMSDIAMDTSQGARRKTKATESNTGLMQGPTLQNLNGVAMAANPNRTRRTVDSNGLPIFSSDSESEGDEY
ncbi:MAG: hypothetical protein AB2693_01105, partial [Candidatus Thiodiazotropha sp.]